MGGIGGFLSSGNPASSSPDPNENEPEPEHASSLERDLDEVVDNDEPDLVAQQHFVQTFAAQDPANQQLTKDLAFLHLRRAKIEEVLEYVPMTEDLKRKYERSFAKSKKKAPNTPGMWVYKDSPKVGNRKYPKDSELYRLKISHVTDMIDDPVHQNFLDRYAEKNIKPGNQVIMPLTLMFDLHKKELEDRKKRQTQ